MTSRAVVQRETCRNHCTRVGTLVVVALVALVVMIAGACTSGSSKHSTTGTTGTTKPPSKLATQYMQILGPADAATGKFFAALKSLPATATGVEAQKIATPAADAIAAADRQLVAVSWPGKVAADVKALVLADAQLVRDLRDLAAQRRVASGPWRSQFERDVGEVSKHVGIVRADLETASTSK
jgi:hypothetical protein